MVDIVAVDPGLSGAVAHVRVEERGAVHVAVFMSVFDIPTMNRNKTNDAQQVNVAELLRNLRALPLDGDRNYRYFIMEHVQAMPSIPGKGGPRRSMGAASAFIFGKTVGHIEASVLSLGLTVEFVHQASWKKELGLRKDKEASRAFAQQLFPAAPLGRKKDHNRAEALLLAHWFATRRMMLIDHMKPTLRKRG